MKSTAVTVLRVVQRRGLNVYSQAYIGAVYDLAMHTVFLRGNAIVTRNARTGRWRACTLLQAQPNAWFHADAAITFSVLGATPDKALRSLADAAYQMGVHLDPRRVAKNDETY